jgi:hypothetical protein
MDTIKNSMRYLQLGIKASSKYNFQLRKWQRVMWFVTLYMWRIMLLFGMIYLIYNLIY